MVSLVQGHIRDILKWEKLKLEVRKLKISKVNNCNKHINLTFLTFTFLNYRQRCDFLVWEPSAQKEYQSSL